MKFLHFSICLFIGLFLLSLPAQAGKVWFSGKNISVDFDGLPFNLSNIAPGMSTSQKKVIIENNENFDIDVYFGAEKRFEVRGLSSVLSVDISQNSTQIYHNHLLDLFSRNIKIFTVNSNSSKDFDIKMALGGEQTGNEYQGGSVEFDFKIVVNQVGNGGGGGGGTVFIPGGGGGLSIYNEAEKTVATTSVTITWQTNYFSTSQVIYAAEGEAHILDLTDTTGTPPKYGYAHTTPEYDVSPKVTGHSVTIYGLTPGTKYYYRAVSHASPPTISREYSFTTLGVAEEIPEIITGEEEGEEAIEEVVEAGEGVSEEIGPISEEEEGPGEEETGTEGEIITPEGEGLPEGVTTVSPGEVGTVPNPFLAALGAVMGGITQSTFLLIIFILCLIGLGFVGCKEFIVFWKKGKRKRQNGDK